jgi:integrase
MKRRPSSKPILVKRGQVTLRITEGVNRVGDKFYPQFTFAYLSGGIRTKRRFASLEEAKSEAERVAARLANGDLEALQLSSTDRLSYVEALRHLQPFKLPLHLATAEYAKAKEKLPPKVTLDEVVEYYVQRHALNRNALTIRQVLDEILASKTKAGRTDVHLKDLESRLGRLAESFQGDICEVTGERIRQFLGTLKGSNRTRLNYLRHISSLFRFAVKRRYVSSEMLDDLGSIDRPQIEGGETQIFTVEELRFLLDVARPEMRPWLAIGAFAGLRHAELQRLDWSEVKLNQGFVEVRAAKSKTASRRLVPISENLARFLESRVENSGAVTAFSNMANQIGWLVEEANKKRAAAGEAPLVWKRNGLRHSFVSYRLALVQDVAKVALEAGNSPAMVFRNYRQLVTPDEARQWFDINPEPVTS